MRRRASEVISELEMRIAYLERQAEIFSPNDIENEYDDADRLSNVDPVLAKHLVVDGDPRKDKISISQTTGDVTQLKPSQTTMDLEKAVFFSFLVLNGSFTTDMGAIVSPEGNILDGHHRWAAWTIALGHKKPKVEYWLARLPGPQLIRVLNVVTKGYLKNMKGNKGTGNIKDFTPKKVQAQLEIAVESGIRSFNAQQCVALLEQNFGSVEAGIEQMAKNTGLMELRTPNWAPARVDMPKIDEKDISGVADLLGKGKVEWKPPYHEIRTSSRERARARKSYILDQDEKKIVQALKRKLRKVGVENLYNVLIVALTDANFHSEAKAISRVLHFQSDWEWNHPTVYDAGTFMAFKCQYDGSCIARVFAEAGKKDTALINALTNQNLL